MSISIQIMWSASTGTVNAYNIYRSTTSGGQNYTGSPYASVAGNMLSYSDTNVVEGQTYFYTVVAVATIGAANLQGSPSPETSLTVPVAPSAPSSSSATFVSV